ncbi:MAG: hypothetical protein KME21_18755 [Desmonostoc vinosum HA7617-LM4]|jgi:hypothetical protein|nr:hypothetical protein [Desmonostoc vinosum HA7617-LM4]
MRSHVLQELAVLGVGCRVWVKEKFLNWVGLKCTNKKGLGHVLKLKNSVGLRVAQPNLLVRRGNFMGLKFSASPHPHVFVSASTQYFKA